MKNIITGFILGILITGTIGVLAANTISSSIVTYNNKTVEKSLDELYDQAVTGKSLIATAITNKGISTNSDATYQTMATNISSIDTDHSTINQKIANLESKHNTDISSINNSIKKINEITSNLAQLSNYSYSKDLYVAKNTDTKLISGYTLVNASIYHIDISVRYNLNTQEDTPTIRLYVEHFNKNGEKKDDNGLYNFNRWTSDKSGTFLGIDIRAEAGDYFIIYMKDYTGNLTVKEFEYSVMGFGH